jgi:hypothetical protein
LADRNEQLAPAELTIPPGAPSPFRSVNFFSEQGVLIMTIAHRIRDTSLDRSFRNYDGLILLGYAAFAVLVLAATYLVPADRNLAGNDFATAVVSTVI